MNDVPGRKVTPDDRASTCARGASLACAMDESEKFVRGLGGLLLAEQSSHQQASELTVPHGQMQPRVSGAGVLF